MPRSRTFGGTRVRRGGWRAAGHIASQNRSCPASSHPADPDKAHQPRISPLKRNSSEIPELTGLESRVNGQSPITPFCMHDKRTMITSRIADNPGVLACWLESKRRVQLVGLTISGRAVAANPDGRLSPNAPQ